ncbi:MAG: hypothetical protein WCA37_07055, partial [Terracidiphilus sp.]
MALFMFSGDAVRIAAGGIQNAVREKMPLGARHWWLFVFFAVAPICTALNAVSAHAQAAGMETASLDDPGPLARPVGIRALVELGTPDFPVRSSLTTSASMIDPTEIAPDLEISPALADIYIALPSAPEPRFQLRKALRQEFEYLMVEHSFRLAQDPALRGQLAHGPFFHDWMVSFQGYDLKRWGDGDNFLVNDIAHPMQGAIAGWIFLQNSPVGSTRVIGKDPQYWTSRMKAMAWATAFEVQWKIGPLSETSIGNAGGWDYVPGCGDTPKCMKNPNYPPPTNNTGLSDWILTPIAGIGWVMMEDAIDKYIVGKAAEHNHLAGVILRSALEPTRNFAALFNGVAPWDRAYGERRFIHTAPTPVGLPSGDNSWRKNRRSVGINFVNVNLPGLKRDCTNCRENHPGIGFPYGFRVLEHVYFDSEVSYLSGDGGGNPTLQGLIGAKFGQQAKSWGLFAKVRPGFIYYD